MVAAGGQRKKHFIEELSMISPRLLTFVLGTAMVAGCAAGPIDSGPIAVTINSLNEGDVGSDGAVWKDGNISTGTSNPWGDFVKAAEEECGGSPVSFEFTSATVVIEFDGSATVDETFGGRAEVRILSTQGSDDDADKAAIASIETLSGAGPHSLDVGAGQDHSSLHSRLLGGDFHVGFWAEVADPDADLDINITITLEALANCE
jgi:hypothetical protein